MPTKIKNILFVFVFQGKHLPGTFCVEKVEKDLAGATFANRSLKLSLILVSNILLRGGFSQKSSPS